MTNLDIMGAMTDIFSRKKRSKIMAAIKSKGTKLEDRGFDFLMEAGVRFRQHPRGIIGNPDAANKWMRFVVFFDSDFWHGYDWRRQKCSIKSNKDFWIPKIEKNMSRDRAVNRALRKERWIVVRLWGHEMTTKNRSRSVVKVRRAWKKALELGCARDRIYS